MRRDIPSRGLLKRNAKPKEGDNGDPCFEGPNWKEHDIFDIFHKG